MNNRYKKINKRGFTLVETLIAIAILLISIAGPLAIISQSLKSSYISRDQITAQYLAQEAIEYARNFRDVGGLKSFKTEVYSDSWLDDFKALTVYNLFSGYSTFPNHYRYLELRREANEYVFAYCPNVGLCGRLKYDPNGAYAIGDVEAPLYSKYRRYITLFRPTSGRGDEFIVDVKVTWTSGISSKSITVREHLSNWQLEKNSI